MAKEIIHILRPFLIVFSVLAVFVSVFNAILPFFDVQNFKKIKVTLPGLLIISALLTIPVMVLQGQGVISSTKENQEPTVSVDTEAGKKETSEPETTAPITEPTGDPGQTIIDVDPGDVLTIGTYAGKSLDWKVLDVSGTKAFLLSTKAVKDVEYHDIKEVTVTWGECSLHKWLNGSFLTNTFSKDEQAAILTTTVDNGTDQGNPEWPNSGSGNTKDKIFLLSYAEFKRYVEGTDFSICEAAYSTKPGEDMRVKLLDNGTEAAFWWLRSPGVNGKQAAFINFEGKCFSNYATNWYLSARPAMWVDINKIDELEN